MIFLYARNEFVWMTWGWWKLIFQRNSSSVHLPRGKAIDSLDKSNPFRLLQFTDKKHSAVRQQKSHCTPKDIISEKLQPHQLLHWWCPSPEPVFFEFSTTASTSSLSPGFFFNIYTLARKIGRVVICDGISSSEQFRWPRGSCKTSCNSRL